MCGLNNYTDKLHYSTNGSIVTGMHDGSEYDYSIAGNFCEVYLLRIGALQCFVGSILSMLVCARNECAYFAGLIFVAL